MLSGLKAVSLLLALLLLTNAGQNSLSSWDVDKHKSASSKGGKKTGKLPLWTNGFINKKGYECPGEGFFRGVTKKKRNSNEIVTYIIEENK